MGGEATPFSAVAAAASLFACGLVLPQDDRARLDGLEQRNRELEARLAALEGASGALHDEAASEEGSDANEAAFFGQLFGNYGFGWSNPPRDGKGASAFQFGTLDFFGTARLGEHASALGEVLLEGSEDDVGIDAERLWAQWQWSDALYAKIGLEHLTTSRWNRLWHHGKYLELTIERPFLARFEDDGGPLAQHYSGLELGGRRLGASGVLEWTAIVFNGRGRDPLDRQRGADDNEAKALDVALGFAPAPIPGFSFGGSARRDVFPGDSAVGRRLGEVEESAAAYAQIERGALTAITEATTIVHHDRAGGVFHHRAAYLQAGWRFAAVTSYARLDLLSMEHGDPFLVGSDLDLDVIELTIGTRFELGSNAAIKLELRRGVFQERFASGATERQPVTTAAFQVAWHL
ncbi:MAG: hypothetical protein EXS13_09305 [Planctomycetes bacterium]|nr:hypothetical protein [Planctomycetota bacterium]